MVIPSLVVPFTLPGNELGFSVRNHPDVIPEDNMAIKLYVGNLAYSVSNNGLHKLFSQAGQLQSASVVADRFSGQLKSFVLVETATA